MCKKLLVATLLVFLSSCQSLYTDRSESASKTYSAGLLAFESNDFRSALDIWLPLAEQGHAEAQLGVGTIYDIHYHKIDADRDWDATKQLAYSWYLKAAEQGNTEAEWVVAVLLEVGSGADQDFEQAAIWYRKAAEKGDAEAQYGLGMLYFDGRGIDQDRVKAFELFKLAAENGHELASWQVAGSYECGAGVPADLSAAKSWYNKAAALGYDSALGRIHLLESGNKDDFCE